MATAIPPLSDSEKIEYGDFKFIDPADDTRSKLVVASYNIRYAAGPFLISGGLLRKAKLKSSRGRAQTVGRHIHAAAGACSNGTLMPRADVLALQEADKQTVRAGGIHVARELAAELKMGWVHVPAGIPRGVKPKTRQWWLDFEEPIGLYDEGDTGIALLSRFPLTEVTRIDLPWQECPWRPRLAMGATVSVGRLRLRIFNVHVDPHAAAGGQLEQLEVIAEQAAASTDPTLILGDFNTLSSKKRIETRRFLEARGYTTPFPTGTPTWRGALIRLHADWIFTRGVEVTNWGVARPLNASDHWPVWLEVDLGQ
jgi:endonuclease/exonuclease/phosphatase family metal-dependent hydrolase